jgi:hypothetical protein
MITINVPGDFSKTDNFLAYLQKGDFYKSVEALAERGVQALAAATPSDTGIAADSWSYEIVTSVGKVTIWWTNNNVDSEGTPIAVLVQYGHGTGTGGYVQGRDFINPAILPIFDQIADEVWKEVSSA